MATLHIAWSHNLWDVLYMQSLRATAHKNNNFMQKNSVISLMVGIANLEILFWTTYIITDNRFSFRPCLQTTKFVRYTKHRAMCGFNRRNRVSLYCNSSSVLLILPLLGCSTCAKGEYWGVYKLVLQVGFVVWWIIVTFLMAFKLKAYRRIT